MNGQEMARVQLEQKGGCREILADTDMRRQMAARRVTFVVDVGRN